MEAPGAPEPGSQAEEVQEEVGGRPSTAGADHPRFADALAAVDDGHVEELARFLAEEPELNRARSTSVEPPYDGYFHGATLLHHVAGNPVRGPLPERVLEVAACLLEAGADPDAGCGGGPTQPLTAGASVLDLVVTGRQPHEAGVAEALIDLLLAHGARLDPDGGMFGALYHTVEHRGQREVAELLHARGVRADLPTAAGLGRLDLVADFFEDDGSLRPGSAEIWARTVRAGTALTDAEALLEGLICAAVNGRTEVVAHLLDRGAAIDGLRPWGPFPVTPLHGAAWAGWPETVTCLLERGADPTVREPTFDATPRGWARHADRPEAVEAFDAAGVVE